MSSTGVRCCKRKTGRDHLALPGPPAMTPDQYCQQKAAASGSSFYYSFVFLEPPRRQAITALYAFCREVDDVVDECPDLLLARTKLAWWREEIAALYAGRPTHPVTQALAQSLKNFSCRRNSCWRSSTAWRWTSSRPAMPTSRRCTCIATASPAWSACSPPRSSAITDRLTLKYAHDLGLAFQLTNIIRDVGKDARRGRIYLPQDELLRFGVSEDDLVGARYSDNFRRLMEFQVERA
jgi:phytoene synthase